jgi:hypothetical protein
MLTCHIFNYFSQNASIQKGQIKQKGAHAQMRSVVPYYSKCVIDKLTIIGRRHNREDPLNKSMGGRRVARETTCAPLYAANSEARISYASSTPALHIISQVRVKRGRRALLYATPLQPRQE